MKLWVGLVLLLAISLTACGGQSSDDKTETLVIGATPVPHVEILEVVKPLLAKEGVSLDIRPFTDYVTPNIALNDKQLDANFFQHLPYLDDFNQKNQMTLVSVAKVHVEPLGAYSQKIKSMDDLADGATVAIPNDATNEGRALLLLQEQGLIKLKDEKGLAQMPRDIVDNPKNLKFSELEAATLPRVLADVDFAIINTNFALEADLNPTADSIFMEGEKSPYANIVVVREDNKDEDKIKKLIKVLNSQEVKDFLKEKYKGAIVPAF